MLAKFGAKLMLPKGDAGSQYVVLVATCASKLSE